MKLQQLVKMSMLQKGTSVYDMMKLGKLVKINN